MTPRKAAARLASRLRREGIRDRAVLGAIAGVPREFFVPAHLAAHAYDDVALPIACNQTISQPYIVALMTESLALSKDSRVLEIGTGSGYQTAVLAMVCRWVFSIEIHAGLSEAAAESLQRVGLRNVTLRTGDGCVGWPEEAPFSGIIMTAAAPDIPPPLLDQLGDGGRLVAPLGEQGQNQELVLVEKQGRAFRETLLAQVRFVPLTGPAIKVSADR